MSNYVFTRYALLVRPLTSGASYVMVSDSYVNEKVAEQAAKAISGSGADSIEYIIVPARG